MSAPEPGHHPVPADPSAVGDVGAPALHRLLLGLLRIPLDQVRIHHQPCLTLFPSTPHISFPPLQFCRFLFSLLVFLLCPHLSPLPSVTLRALLFWAGCHRDLHVSIMICAAVTTRCSAAHGDEREEERDNHASESNLAWHLSAPFSLHKHPHNVLCRRDVQGPNANQRLTEV